MGPEGANRGLKAQDHNVRSVGENGTWFLHEGNYGRVITPTVNNDSTGTSKGRNKDDSQEPTPSPQGCGKSAGE